MGVGVGALTGEVNGVSEVGASEALRIGRDIVIIRCSMQEARETVLLHASVHAYSNYSHIQQSDRNVKTECL